MRAREYYPDPRYEACGPVRRSYPVSRIRIQFGRIKLLVQIPDACFSNRIPRPSSFPGFDQSIPFEILKRVIDGRSRRLVSRELLDIPVDVSSRKTQVSSFSKHLQNRVGRFIHPSCPLSHRLTHHPTPPNNYRLFPTLVPRVQSSSVGASHNTSCPKILSNDGIIVIATTEATGHGRKRSVRDGVTAPPRWSSKGPCQRRTPRNVKLPHEFERERTHRSAITSRRRGRAASPTSAANPAGGKSSASTPTASDIATTASSATAEARAK